MLVVYRVKQSLAIARHFENTFDTDIFNNFLYFFKRNAAINLFVYLLIFIHENLYGLRLGEFNNTTGTERVKQ